VKLDRAIQGHESSLGEDTECFEDTDSTGTVIVCTWSREKREKIVSRILVCAQNRQRLFERANFWLEAGDNRRLAERVCEIFQ
jgi:hypothetical protein